MTDAENDFSVPIDTPIPFKTISAPMLKGDRDCWGCENCFDRQQSNVMAKAVNKLFETYAQNVERMGIKQLGLLLARKFDELICRPVVLSNKQKRHGEPHDRIPKWSVQGILTHFKDHMVDVAMQLKYAIQNLTVVEETLMNQVHQREGATGNTITDIPKVDALLRVTKVRLQLVDTLNGSKRGKH